MAISPLVCRLIVLARLTSRSNFQLLMKLLPEWAQHVWKRAGTRYHSRRAHWLFFRKQLDTVVFSFQSCPSGFASDVFQSNTCLGSAHALLHIIISTFSGVLWHPSARLPVFLMTAMFVCIRISTGFLPPPQASSSGWTVHLSAAPGYWAPGCRGSRVPAAWTWPCSCTPSKADNTPFGW